MPVLRRCCVMLACAYALAGTTLSPQTGSSAVGASGNPAGAPEQASQSLADMARKLRKDKPAEVRMTEEEGKELFRSVDRVFSFASEETGFPRRTAVKKQVVGPADIERFTKQRLSRISWESKRAIRRGSVRRRDQDDLAARYCGSRSAGSHPCPRAYACVAGPEL